MAMRKAFHIGFSNLTIDELANDLRISKKTIYKYFPSKQNILETIIRYNMNRISKRHDEILALPINAIQKLHLAFDAVWETLRDASKAMIEDLQKSSPSWWQEVDEFRKNRIVKTTHQIWREGIEQGLFRPEINEDVFAFAYWGAIQTVVNPDFLITHSVSIVDVLNQIKMIMMNGVLNERGRKVWTDEKETVST